MSGVASYNRGTALIRRHTDADARRAEFIMMNDLNAMPKDAGAARPFSSIHFSAGHGGWWAECPVTGFGYWYPSLRAAVRRWRVVVTGYSNGTWIGDPS